MNFDQCRRLLSTFVFALLLTSCSTPEEISRAPAETAAPTPRPAVVALPPAASIATMEMPKGYRLEPVLAEPDIAEPVMVAFDGNGRMYVAEMRTYMQDADAKG